MAYRQCMVALSAASGLISLWGCSSSPFVSPSNTQEFGFHRLTSPQGSSSDLGSIYRDRNEDTEQAVIRVDSTPESYVRYALYHSPHVEKAYQQWIAASERLPQVRSLPDPRLNIGFFIEEVETRVGPQQAKIGIQQTLPWIGTLQNREDAAAKGALSAWYRYQEAQTLVVEQVIIALYNLAYLDEAIRITGENLALLQSFEEVVRARYRVGAGSHPELIRVQVELEQLEDRVLGLKALRPSYVANLNAELNRSPETKVVEDIQVPNSVVSESAEQVSRMAHQWSPVLQSIIQRVEQERIGTKVAQKDGYPDLTVGVEYIVTDNASNPSVAESGDDPIMLTFGINLPIWREKYNAGVRESIAKRLTISRELDTTANQLSAQIYRSWFEHTDADRRVRLYENSLIPKAQESISASLSGFRSGDSGFLDLLDTQRTLLEFSIAAEKARADRGKALATLNRLVGRPVSTFEDQSQETQTNSGVQQ